MCKRYTAGSSIRQTGGNHPEGTIIVDSHEAVASGNPGQALRSCTFGSFHAARTVNSTKLETWKERGDRERANAPFGGACLANRTDPPCAPHAPDLSTV